jgi:hypothetical protein
VTAEVGEVPQMGAASAKALGQEALGDLGESRRPWWPEPGVWGRAQGRAGVRRRGSPCDCFSWGPLRPRLASNLWAQAIYLSSWDYRCHLASGDRWREGQEWTMGWGEGRSPGPLTGEDWGDGWRWMTAEGTGGGEGMVGT